MIVYYVPICSKNILFHTGGCTWSGTGIGNLLGTDIWYDVLFQNCTCIFKCDILSPRFNCDIYLYIYPKNNVQILYSKKICQVKAKSNRLNNYHSWKPSQETKRAVFTMLAGSRFHLLSRWRSLQIRQPLPADRFSEWGPALTALRMAVGPLKQLLSRQTGDRLPETWLFLMAFCCLLSGWLGNFVGSDLSAKQLYFRPDRSTAFQVH